MNTAHMVQSTTFLYGLMNGQSDLRHLERRESARDQERTGIRVLAQHIGKGNVTSLNTIQVLCTAKCLAHNKLPKPIFRKVGCLSHRQGSNIYSNVLHCADSKEVQSRSITQKIRTLLWRHKTRSCVLKIPSVVPVLTQGHIVLSLKSHLVQTHFNIVFRLHLGLSVGLFPTVFRLLVYVCLLCISFVLLLLATEFSSASIKGKVKLSLSMP